MAKWLDGDGVGIGHYSPVEECEPVVEIEDCREWACFRHVAYVEGSVVEGSSGNVAWGEAKLDLTRYCVLIGRNYLWMGLEDPAQLGVAFLGSLGISSRLRFIHRVPLCPILLQSLFLNMFHVNEPLVPIRMPTIYFRNRFDIPDKPANCIQAPCLWQICVASPFDK